MITKIVEEDLKALRAIGCHPTDAQIIHLNDLALKIETSFDTSTHAPRTAIVGSYNNNTSVCLHEPTVGALCWWYEFGSNASQDADDKLMIYFFMLANARDLDVLNALKTPKDILKAVASWMRKCSATNEELWAGLLWVKFGNEDAQNLLDEKQEEEEGEDEDDDTMDELWNIILEVSGMTGISPNELKTQTLSSLNALLKRANARAGYDMTSNCGDKAKYYIAYKRLLKSIEDERLGNTQNG